MKKLIKFEKNDCNPCAMVSEFLDKKGVKGSILYGIVVSSILAWIFSIQCSSWKLLVRILAKMFRNIFYFYRVESPKPYMQCNFREINPFNF